MFIKVVLNIGFPTNRSIQFTSNATVMNNRKDLKVQTPLYPLLLELNCSLMVEKKKKFQEQIACKTRPLPMDLDIHVNHQGGSP